MHNKLKKGYNILTDAALNKGTAFTREERDVLNLRGLLPYTIRSQETQIELVLENLRRKENDIEKYIFLRSLAVRNERLFYRTMIDNIEELMPYIYTPTVGQACKEFAHIFRSTNGFYITPDDIGGISKILDNWPQDNVKVVVITDGERILGLGDLGANGMGIPIGKLHLYTACAGIDPSRCLPIMLDVGTNNETFLNEPMYLGYPKCRVTGQLYFDLVDELIFALRDKYKNVLIQFEDFLTPNAYKLLTTYYNQVLCFNDDIQGTATVALAGVYASTRITGIQYRDLRIMFLGAGSAATGIADLMVPAFVKQGLTIEEARRRLWFVDIQGLIVNSRDNLMPHNLPYAHPHAPLNFVDAIGEIKPHVLIGASGSPNSFTYEAITAMSKINPNPVIFALSNPLSHTECTAQQAYEWSNGKAIFVSGSPFDKASYKGQIFRPGQGNNAYAFPGIGLGAIIAKANHMNDEVFLAAAQALSDMVSDEDIKQGTLYPPFKDMRTISLKIAVAVAQCIHDSGFTDSPIPTEDWAGYISMRMYNPAY